MIRYLLVALALTIVACTRQPPPEAPDLTPFERALAARYEARRAAERAENDWGDARLFRRKRDAALSGEPPLPDDLTARALDDRLRRALLDARGRLVIVLDTVVTALIAPDALAEAQGAFDCWAQEAEEGLQPDEIAACRAEFEAALVVAERASTASVVVLLPSEAGSAIEVRDEDATVAIDEPFGGVATTDATLAPAVRLDENAVADSLSGSLGVEPRAQRSYLIYFVTGGRDIEGITEDSRARFDEALADVGETQAARVTVFGHTDRVGSAALNVRLARSRAEAIRDALMAAGVPEDAITADSFGESFPLVPTADGVAEPLNRRVEIAVR